jgi:hypothetical protein
MQLNKSTTDKFLAKRTVMPQVMIAETNGTPRLAYRYSSKHWDHLNESKSNHTEARLHDQLQLGCLRYSIVGGDAPKRTSTELAFCPAPHICLQYGVSSTLGKSGTNIKAGSRR